MEFHHLYRIKNTQKILSFVGHSSRALPFIKQPPTAATTTITTEK